MKISHFILLLSATFVLSSCLKDNETDINYYNDAAITAFSIGNLKRPVHAKTTAGKDTVYTVKVTGSAYKFNIDQLNNIIYNADSLPYKTDVSRVVCKISSKNSGLISQISVNNDSAKLYQEEDSIDFTKPRTFIVNSTDGTASRKYLIKVNVHTELADSFQWHRMPQNSDFAGMKAMRALYNNGEMFLFGTEGTVTSVYSSTDGNSWQNLTPDINMVFDKDAYGNITVMEGYIYMLTSKTLLRTQNGRNWEIVGLTELTKLIGASTSELYGMNAEGIIMSSKDNGKTWKEDITDEDKSLLPTEDISCICRPSAANKDIESVMIVGNRNLDKYPNDAYATAWNKVIDRSKSETGNGWAYVRTHSGNKFVAPRIQNFTVIPYAGGALAFGGDGIGGCKATAFGKMYFCEDGGITWKEDKRFAMPKGFESSNTSFAAAVDDKNVIWIICGESGQVWRGRLNRLGWATEQTSFNE